MPKQIPPEQWKLAKALFERLLETEDAEAMLDGEPDAGVAALARRLLKNDQRATADGFLAEPNTLVRRLRTFEDVPCFQPGQVLAGRFTVESALGAGGMGEVYLAYDARLEERVALKTIRRDLAVYAAVGRRFLAEVSHARRVSHPHVCRINDLFDHGDTPFFTMKLLEGITLNQWLTRPDIRQPTRMRIAVELAEGLFAAHLAKVVHCDFKPSNIILTGPPENPSAVITDFGLARAFTAAPVQSEWTARLASYSLRAGTRGYVAPELATGSFPDARSDIYSYGKVLAELLPGNKLAEECAAENPEDRPATLEQVIRELRGGFTRRVLLLVSVLAAAGTAGGSYALFSTPHFVLGGRQRVAVNGFRPGGPTQSSMVRDLLITALRQSPLLMVMPDDRLQALLRQFHFSPQLPVDPASLLAIAAHEEALVIEGVLQEAGAGMQLLLEVFLPGQKSPALRIAEKVADRKQVVRLADQTAGRLRREFGESVAAMKSGYTPLEKVTSASPEAVDLYFRGVREYERAHVQAAVTFLDQAVRLDPNFALAHAHLGLAHLAHYESREALASQERAFQLRAGLPERERLYIEVRYDNLIGDFEASYKASRRLVALYPEEAVFQRGAGFAAVRVGRPLDALPFNQRAVDLDPNSENNLSELVVNHCDAGKPERALEIGSALRQRGNNSPMLNYCLGNAYFVMEDHKNARLSYERMSADAELERWSRLLCCGPTIMEGRFAEASSTLRSDLAYDIATGEQRNLQNRRMWLGMLAWLMNSATGAKEQVVALAALDASPIWLLPLRVCGMLALFLDEPVLASVALERLREIERRCPSTNSKGSRTHLEGAMLLKQNSLGAGELLNEARGLWPDCLTLYSFAKWQMQQEDFAGAAATLAAFEADKGRILRLYIPPFLILGRIERARCLARVSDFAESRRLYEWVLRSWGAHAGSYRIMQEVFQEYRKLHFF
jgi:serine/threonine protein kinase/tetratricopeptide (TPR) repeat protein